MIGYERYKYVKYYDEKGNLLLPSEALVNARYTYVLGDDGKPTLREIMVCSLPKFNANGYGMLSDGRDKAGRRAEPFEAENATPPKSEWRSRHRAIVAIRDILDCNTFEWFVTLTLDSISPFLSFTKMVLYIFTLLFLVISMLYTLVQFLYLIGRSLSQKNTRDDLAILIIICSLSIISLLGAMVSLLQFVFMEIEKHFGTI